MIIIFLGILFASAAVCVFSNTDQILLQPLTTPEAFLLSMPYTSISLFGQDYVLIQPSSTIFVYGLGLIMIFIGGYLLFKKENQKSREYWGIGLILWGVSAIAAGTSYQAFGYELKCKGREFCLFTDHFELVYMLLTAFSINFLVAATGFTSLGDAGRKRMLCFAIIDSILYFAYMMVGAIVPIQFLVSYEGFMTFIGVNFILMFVINIRHFVKFKDPLNRNLILIWIGFLVVNVGYFVFLLGGFADRFYQNNGIWFNANDILHILLILWSMMIFMLLKRILVDVKE